MARITLSGPNNELNPRTVFLDGVDIGTVRPHTVALSILWEATDKSHRCHGDRYLTDWCAADALSRSYNIPEVAHG